MLQVTKIYVIIYIFINLITLEWCCDAGQFYQFFFFFFLDLFYLKNHIF